MSRSCVGHMMQSSDRQLGAICVLCVLLGCRSLLGVPALCALLWDIAPEAGLWLPALQQSCSRAASCPRLQRWSCGELDPVCGEDGHHVRPASQQRGQGTRNIPLPQLVHRCGGRDAPNQAGEGLCYWGPAAQQCIACYAAFLSFSPAE